MRTRRQRAANVAAAGATADSGAVGEPRPFEMVLSLVALFTLGFGQPLLDLLGRNAPFFVAHDAGRLDVLAIGIGLTLGVPILIAAGVLVVRAVNRRAGAALHLALVAILVAILVLVLATVAEASRRLPGVVLIGLGLLCGVGAAALYRSKAPVRRAVSVAAVAAPVVAGLFLFASPVSGLVVGGQQVDAEVTAGTGDLPPIVYVIFDEFPAASLLDQQLQVDATLYPAFGRLAEDSTFFRNYTTVHEATVDAVPAALSGRFSDPRALPNAAGHPTNLFSLLGSRYLVRAAEPVTDLCTTPGCDPSLATGASSGAANKALLRDLGVVAGHLVVPEDMAAQLPPVDASWGDFGVGGVGDGERLDKPMTRRQRREAVADPERATGVNHPQELSNFIQGIKESSRPTLNFVHTLFPHRPWRYLPDGRLHTLPIEPQLKGETWPERTWPVAQGYQLHLAHVQLADKLIGALTARLREFGMYDDALIVVTADHGINFVPGFPLRNPSPDTIGGIGSVPLFIKAPGQKAGAIDDRPMQSVDIVPTMLDLLGADPQVELDGRSMVDESPPPLRERVMLHAEGFRETYPVDITPQLRAAVELKYSLLGRMNEPDDLFRIAPAGTEDLLGSKVPEGIEAADGLQVEVELLDAFENVKLSSNRIPARVRGRVVGADPSDPPVLAVAVNGTIAAVTIADAPARTDGAFRALMPPSVLREGHNDVQFLLVAGGKAVSSLPVAD